MLKSTEKIIDAGLNQHIISETNLSQLFDKSPASRYALVNKAVQKEELIRLRRGLYLLANKYCPQKFSQYYLANHIVAESYVSMESALAYYGWIPEAIRTIYSIVINSRNKIFRTPLGEFVYYNTPVNNYQFLTGVAREQVNNQAFFMATPLRAIVDLVYIRKLQYDNLEFLTESLRMERNYLDNIQLSDIIHIRNVYRSQHVHYFLNLLSQAKA